MFFAAYVGSSMNPTLREPEMMEIFPYDNLPLRIGDVVFYLPSQTEQPVVHRIVRMTPEGISTRGDNNASKDDYLLQPENIQGQVMAAWRGQKRRKIAGGWPGSLRSLWLHGCRLLGLGLFPLLHPAYQALARWGLLARALPLRFRPRVVAFRARGQDHLQLLLGRRIIGRYDDHRQQWQIRRPFHLLVNARALPGQPDRDRVDRQVLTGRQRRPASVAAETTCGLVLADGSHWEVDADDPEAAEFVLQLARAMRLNLTPRANKPSHHNNLNRLIVRVDADFFAGNAYVPLASKADGIAVCVLSPNDSWGGPHMNLVRLSLIFAREAQARGGVLIHGALTERDGSGVILAAPGGTGKTTASNRLPAPWRSLCDDTTLVVRDPQGRYWAHPWPTWSRFLDGGPGGTWDVQNPVPLAGIFILAQSVEDRAERVGPGQAVSLLVECARQASQFMPLGLFKEEVHELHMEQFDNLCALARVVPAHVLHISLTGAFWREMEPVLGGANGTCKHKPNQ